MLTAKIVSEYFLKMNNPEFGDGLSNLKVQKLVYYAQGFHLALTNGQKLFQEPILAWEHGPVVESLYYQYREHGSNEIPQPESVDINLFTQEQIEILNEVFEVYGQFSAWKLRNMTHSESPWTTTTKNQEITTDKMLEFFKTLLVN